MLFIGSVLVLQWIVIVQCFRNAGLIRSGTLNRKEASFTACGMLAAAALISIPLLHELAIIAASNNGRSVAMEAAINPLWCLGLGGLLAVGMFGWRLFRQRTQSTAGFWAIGANAIGALVGLYMLFVVIDQLTFFELQSEDAGMVNWDFFRADGAVKDIDCQSDMLVVKGLLSGTATYRCPNLGTIVFGRFSGAPLVPWPSYTEGTSNQLAAEVLKMRQSAVKSK